MRRSRPQQNDVPQVHLQSREIVTRYQMETILNVMQMSAMALVNMLVKPDVDGKLEPVNTEARISAENTFRSACERLDKILGEDSRWSTEFQDKVEKQFADAQTLQMQVLEDQRKAALEVRSPHFRYRPAILRLIDGTWAAFLGDVDHMEMGIVGVGATPQDAVEAFDDAFRGVTNEKVLAWTKEREQHLEQGTEHKAPFPNIENENQTLDGSGNQNPQGNAPGREHGEGNFNEAGPVP